ncbi:uncharacterized protein LOC128266932 [Anopheles cruzii]|uniref:uncharacterized protein LOC128266932 n=1 Tax=Anopheles cruzii TaxID=68878 RepID=UPI0022EC4870|nr:uncharacterized protein LOC128266932 [Anopheles cruzii]
MSNSDNSNNESAWFLRRLHQTEFRTIEIPREGPIKFMRDNPMSCIHLNSVDYRHVSRTHCTVECVNGQLVITDDSSSTGTHINGQKILNKKNRGTEILKEGDVIGIGCPAMYDDSYYQIQKHALLFRVCRHRPRVPTVKTEDNVIVISDDESLGETTNGMSPSSAAPTTLEQKVEQCEPPDKPFLPPLLHANEETGSRSPNKVELPYQSDSEINDVELPPLHRIPDSPVHENSEDSTVIVLDDDEYTDQHYSQMVLENIKTESVDVPDEGQDANDCPDVLLSERSVLDVSKKKEHHKQIAKKLQEVAAKESTQKTLEARQRIGAQQKTGVTLPRLELRHDIWDYYKKSSRLWYVRLTDTTVGENTLKVFHCEVHTRGRNDMPLLSAGMIGVLDYPTLDGQRNRCFGHIIRNIKACFSGSNNNSAGTSFQRYTCQMNMLSDQLVMEKHKDDSITFRPITSISSHIRQAIGLCMMEHSRILPIILDPEQNREQVVVPENAFKKHSKVRMETVARITPNALNEGQMNVMLSVLEECCLVESPSVSLIQGPPGTGKSRVISQLALELWRFRRPAMKVMICAQSNTAVDVIAAKLIDLRNDLAEGHRFNLVRIGAGDKIDASCRSIVLEQIVYQKMQDKRLLPNDGHIKLEEVIKRLSSLKMDARRDCESTKRDIMEAADIVCTTLGSCHVIAAYCDTIFDVCIIDEASQCTEPSSFVPLQYDMTKLVLVGDVKQLPATVVSNKSKQAGFCDSLFSRMYKWFHRANFSAGIKMLNVQYRMHPEICSWPNNHFYDGRLICHPTTAAGGKLPLLPYLVLSLGYDQELTQIQHQVYNRDELVFVVKLLKQVLTYCRKDTSVAIITPYQRHKSELVFELKRNQLQQIAVHSIDSVQGKEFDIVFVSLARSIGTGFLNSGERINVALTRARHSLILCGNFGSLMRTPVWSALLKDAQERKVLHELEGVCADTDVNSIVKKLRIRPNL